MGLRLKQSETRPNGSSVLPQSIGALEQSISGKRGRRRTRRLFWGGKNSTRKLWVCHEGIGGSNPANDIAPVAFTGEPTSRNKGYHIPLKSRAVV